MAECRKGRGCITLIGMPACGKSTVGVVLAKKLGMRFIDTDLVIQEQTGKLLKELIAEHGDEGFRAIEDRINASIDAENAVIAPGGSAVYGKKAMAHFRESGPGRPSISCTGSAPGCMRSTRTWWWTSGGFPSARW